MLRKRSREGQLPSLRNCGSIDEYRLIDAISVKNQGIEADLEAQETSGADDRVLKETPVHKSSDDCAAEDAIDYQRT